MRAEGEHKTSPWPNSPSATPRSLLQNSIWRAAGPSRGQGERVPWRVLSITLLLFPHSRPIPVLMLAGLPEERSTPRYLFSAQQRVFRVFDLRWRFMCFMSSDSTLCGGPQDKSGCRVWLLKIILQQNRIPYIFNFLISQLLFFPVSFFFSGQDLTSTHSLRTKCLPRLKF